ncbi:MAG: DUF4255 domain-containing protein [Dehalococcoidia bacterium]|nr:DUF4255 domain-containing protein [Dehalococcoidia bacterium]
MTLLDLSVVTQSLVRYLDASVRSSPGWSAGLSLTVTPEPPDRLAGDRVLGLYLYHVSEDPSLRNEGMRSSEYPPVRYQPMPLRLHYQLVAHSDLDGDEATYTEQRMFGIAMKALHDTPVITDATVVDGTPAFPPGSEIVESDNRLRIELQQVSREEARAAWQADQTPTRLAAYYLVSVVLLEAEEPRRRPGRVLTPGVQVFTLGAPRLASSVTSLRITRPGGEEGTVQVRPAQAPPGATVTFEGGSLGGGTLSFLLRAPHWDAPIAVDTLAWQLRHSDSQVSVQVRETAGGEDVLPGAHGAIVERTATRAMPDGTPRDFVHRSNEAPFMILPRIDAVSTPSASGVFSVTGHRFQHPALATDAVSVLVADGLLEAGSAGSLASGEFAVTGPNTIEVRLPSGLASGREAPVRVFVNGAESLPRWVVVP